MNLSEIEEKVKSLRETKELTPVGALSIANEIVGAINKVVEVKVEKENYKTLENLYEKAAETYLLAAEKVPKESRDRVAFPANYWSMRATQVRLKQKWVLDELLSGDFSKIDPIASAIKEMPDSDKQQYLDEIILKLEDENADVRWRAAVALGRIGDAKAVEPLIEAFKDKDSYVRDKAEEALENICADAVKKIGADAVKPLIGALKDDNPKMRASAAKTLGKIGSRLISKPVVKFIIGVDKFNRIIKDIVNALTETLEKTERNLEERFIIENALDNIKAKQKSK